MSGIVPMLAAEAARFRVVFSIIYIPAAIAYFVMGYPFAGFVLVSAVVPAIFLLSQALLIP